METFSEKRGFELGAKMNKYAEGMRKMLPAAGNNNFYLYVARGTIHLRTLNVVRLSALICENLTLFSRNPTCRAEDQW